MYNERSFAGGGGGGFRGYWYKHPNEWVSFASTWEKLRKGNNKDDFIAWITAIKKKTIKKITAQNMLSQQSIFSITNMNIA